MPHAWRCIAVACILSGCVTVTQSSDEMIPGVNVRTAISSVPERPRRPIPVMRPMYEMPSSFSFLPDSWVHENVVDTSHRNDGNPRAMSLIAGRSNREEGGSEGASIGFPRNAVRSGHEYGEETSPMMGMNFNKMSMREQLMMSSVGTVEEFARLVGISLPISGSVSVAASTSGDSSIAARFGGAPPDDLPVATAGNCEPMNETVLLKIEPQLNVMFFPRCVRLPRCGGCCTGPLLKCRPTEVRPVKLKILRVQQQQEEEDIPMGRSGSIPTDVAVSTGRGRRVRPGTEGGRRRREAVAKYEFVDEEEHLACSCQCRVLAEDCNSGIQNYLESECRCACKNEDENKKCEQKSETHYWNKDDCMCYCYDEQPCSTGDLYDHNSCSCVSANIRDWSNVSLRRGAAVPARSAAVAFPTS